MKFKTIALLTAILLLSFFAFIYFSLRHAKGPDPYSFFAENFREIEKISSGLLSQENLYMISKPAFNQGEIIIAPRTGNAFNFETNNGNGIDTTINRGINFSAFCTEYKLDKNLINRMIKLILNSDIFFIKRNFGDSIIVFGTDYEERIVFKPNGTTEFEKKRYKLIRDNWYYLKERM